jgi:hypothetical protein
LKKSTRFGELFEKTVGNAINLSSEEILSGNFIVFAEDISNVKLKALFLEVEHEGISGLKA